MRTLACSLLSFALSLGFGQSENNKESKNPGKLWAAISVNKVVIDHDVMTEDPFVVVFALVNDGEKPQAPHIEESKLLVNGEEMKDWRRSIGSGLRAVNFDLIPPGDYTSFAKALGEQFKEPGVYRLKWKGERFESSEIVFRVVSRKKR